MPVIASRSRLIAYAATAALACAPVTAQVGFAAANKPGAPRITKVTSQHSQVSSAGRYVDVVVTFLPSTSGATATSFTVAAGSARCHPRQRVTTCTFKKIKVGTPLALTVQAKTRDGSTATSVSVSYTAGASTWPGVPDAPRILRITSLAGDVTLHFAKPSNNGGATVTNYAFSTDGGKTWKVRSPRSTLSPLRIARVSAGAHNFKVRAINSSGDGVASATVNFTVAITKQSLMPIRFKSLIGSRGIVVRQRTRESLRQTLVSGRVRAGGDNVTDTTEVESIDAAGNLAPAVAVQTGPVNIDRIFVGPQGRIVATLGMNEQNCSIAEINPASGQTVCLATTDVANLTNVDIADQQISGLTPIKFDDQDDVFVSSVNSLIRISPAGEIAKLVSEDDDVCIQRWVPLSNRGIIAFVDHYGIHTGCSTPDRTVLIAGEPGSISWKEVLANEGIFSLAATQGGNAIMGTMGGAMSFVNASDGSLTALSFEHPDNVSVQFFSQAKTLTDGRTFAIAGAEQAYAGVPVPLMQINPQQSSPDSIHFISNVPLPFLSAKLAGSRLVVAGLADADVCSRYAAIWPFDSECPNTARLSIYDVDTRTDVPIDLVNATGATGDAMDIYFLSGSPDGSQIAFAGRCSNDHYQTSYDVIGITDTATGKTKITRVEGLLGLSAF